MSRKDDLEASIRESYDLIRQHEELIKTSREPLDIKRWQGEISRQWELIRGCLDEYTVLSGGTEMPADIAAIAAHFAAPPQRAVPPEPAPEPPPVTASFNTVAVHDLLNAAFNDEDLTRFCYLHFRPVYDNFSAGMSKGQKVLRLIDYCDRRRLMSDLLSRVREVNPTLYAEFAPRLTA